jgi:hypothetical protein
VPDPRCPVHGDRDTRRDELADLIWAFLLEQKKIDAYRTADAILASDWLAAHVTRATADAEARLANAWDEGYVACREARDGGANPYRYPAPTTAEVCEHGFRPEPGRCPAGCTTATHTRYGQLAAPTTDADA